MATSKVLGDDDLLCEILIRLDSPTSLVRAALVSKRWLLHASHGAFLRRFRALRPPRLLGFFVTGDCVPRPEFVSMPAPEPQDPKFSAALRHARSVFDAFPEFSSGVWDCRNGRVVFDFTETVQGVRRFGVSDPLRRPAQGVAELPPPPPTWPDPSCPHAMLLPDDEHDDASCYRVDIHAWGRGGRRVSAQVSVLRSGAWTVLASAWTKLDRPPDRIPMLNLLAGGKLYMVAVAGYVIWMDLAAAAAASSRLFVVEFPEGVTYEYYGNLVLCRGDDSVLCLLHLKGDRLSVWQRRMDVEERGAEWVLRDTISLRETCGHVVASTDDVEPASVAGVGDNAEFVFLELNCGAFVHMNIRSRRVEKVYQRDPDNDEITLVHDGLASGLSSTGPWRRKNCIKSSQPVEQDPPLASRIKKNLIADFFL